MTSLTIIDLSNHEIYLPYSSLIDPRLLTTQLVASHRPFGDFVAPAAEKRAAHLNFGISRARS